jgi:HAD superfamily hydrolase (TIGR01509 family)
VSEVRAVLLDLYDTLVWSDWPALRALIEARAGVSSRRLLDAFERTRPSRSVGAHGSMEGDLAAVLEAAGLDRDDAMVRDLAGLITSFLETGVHLWDDSVPVLRELRARGVKTAIVSNSDHGTRPVVERLGLPGEADAVVLSFEVGSAKPDPGIYRTALDALGATPERSVFVDDQPDYCEGAEALGIRSFLILRDGDHGTEGPNTDGGRGTIRDLRSLLDLV